MTAWRVSLALCRRRRGGECRAIVASHVDADVAGVADELLDDGTCPPALPARRAVPRGDDMGEIVGAGMIEHCLGDILLRQGHGVRAEPRSQPEIIRYPFPLRRR
ncbi:MAG: hypothetical protein WDN69_16705 [Aliidongia sp.]